jgi:glutaredoxin
MKLINSLTTLAICVTLCTACRGKDTPKAQGLQASALPVIKVTKASKLLLTYYAGGKFVSATDIEKVPQGSRGWVRVVDLALKAGQRKDLELVYVADLRKPNDKGAYPYVVMSRPAFESSAQGRATAGATDPKGKTSATKSGAVVLYSTSWCPACKSARRYLSEKGIPFVEKDIEKDSAAAAELMSKAQAAGISTSGVPVLDVNGTLMQGFDAQRLEALIGGRK